jgi:hypothetical protein
MGDDAEGRVLTEMLSSATYHREVVDLAGVRLARGMLKPRQKKCDHLHLIISQSERLIECEDCNRSVDAFDAVMVVMRHMEGMLSEVNGRKRQADEAMVATLHLRGAKAIEQTWRRSMAPCCPHCRQGILPEDFGSGVGSSISRDLEIARRARDRANPAKNSASIPSEASTAALATDDPLSSIPPHPADGGEP